MKRVERLLSMAGIREPNLNFYDLITWDYLLMDLCPWFCSVTILQVYFLHSVGFSLSKLFSYL